MHCLFIWFARKLPVKNYGEIASSEHVYCSMVTLFLKRLSNHSTEIVEVIITENRDFTKKSR
jgi:hypothetical protein